MIDAVVRFARKDIKDIPLLQKDEFSHVADPDLRIVLAETFYGARWLYKLGLALLANGDEQLAHVRAQVIDYGSIVETLLADLIIEGYKKNKLQGSQFNTDMYGKSLNWSVAKSSSIVFKQSFFWRIKVAEESKIIDANLSKKLSNIRIKRNTVHLTQKVESRVTYFSRLAKESNVAMLEAITQTKVWAKKNL